MSPPSAEDRAVLSAMRHFSRALAARGVRVDHVRLDDPANTQSFRGEVRAPWPATGPTRIVATHPGEWRVLQDMLGWQAATGIPSRSARIRASSAPCRASAPGRRGGSILRMEFFYREMRRETGLLMEGDEPAGGQWNFDAENRAALPKGLARRRRAASRRTPSRAR
jgi:deoxyribodipyrimidine photolyase-related protein